MTLLRPGGRLVYCTCSLLWDEGEEQIKDLLERNTSASVDLDALQLGGISPEWIGPFGLRTRPDYWSELGGMDGFFISVIRKN
jgi:16S rRNA (cytosine967-C5)-methyltransferase